MSENLLQTLQHLIQDVIAPDVRELKVRVASLEKQMDVRFDSVDSRFKSFDDRFDAMEKRSSAQFEAIMAALRESKAQSELTSFRAVAALSEHVAVLEVQRH